MAALLGAHAGACCQKMSATSEEGRPPAEISSHVGVHGGGLQALVSQQNLDHTDVDQQVSAFGFSVALT